MRVLTFLHSFEPGGVERIALRLVRQWRLEGRDAHLFLGRNEGPMAHDIGDGLAFVAPPQPPIQTGPFETLWMILTLPRVVRAVRPDILFCAGNSYTIVAVVLKLLLGRRCPPIVSKISNDLERRDMSRPIRAAYHLWLRFQGRFLDHLVGMDDPMRLEIADAMGRAPGDISIIPDPALSQDLISTVRAQLPGAPDPGARRFVAVSRLVAQKNLSMMLRAFARAGGKDDRLTIFGDGPERKAITRLAEDLGIRDQVTFKGHVAEPSLALRQFDTLLLSSDYEGVPAALLEALAANLFVVATDCSRSMRALLGDGRFGLLSPVGEEAAFAQAIRTSRLRTQDSGGSLAQAERFTIERASGLYWRCFEKAAGRLRKSEARLREQSARAVISQPVTKEWAE